MILFTHLKIILLQCFQFSATISSIQTHPIYIYIYIYIYYKHAALNKENLEEHTQKKKTLERNKVSLDNHGWVHH